MTRPLVVDLDGTYFYEDMLKQDLKRYIGISPFRVIQCLCWGLQGRTHLKLRLANLSLIDYQGLKLNQKVVDLIVSSKGDGAYVILMTGSAQMHAHKVAELSGLFDEVIASSSRVNMVGVHKRSLLVERYGLNGYDYIGNSRQDIAVWSAAAVAYATNIRRFTKVMACLHKIDLKIIDGVAG